jgi:Flp pilus assembly protein TadG
MTIQGRRSRRNRARRSGATIVEFALLVPVLLAILLGILESGWMVKNYLTLANATRDGARGAAVGQSTTATQTRIQNLAQPLSLVSPNGSIVYEYSTDNGSTYVPWPADSNNKNSDPTGKLLRITTTTKHQPLTGFFGFLTNRQLRVSVTMRREP